MAQSIYGSCLTWGVYKMMEFYVRVVALSRSALLFSEMFWRMEGRAWLDPDFLWNVLVSGRTGEFADHFHPSISDCIFICIDRY